MRIFLLNLILIWVLEEGFGTGIRIRIRRSPIVKEAPYETLAGYDEADVLPPDLMSVKSIKNII